MTRLAKTIFFDRTCLFVVIYLLFVLTQFSYFLTFSLVTPQEVLRKFVIYIFPVVFYFLFRVYKYSGFVKSFLLGVSISSLLATFYYAYEAFSKSILRTLPLFAQLSHNYSLNALGLDNCIDCMNLSRIGIQYKAVGLLETHPVSAAWIFFGCVSLLTLMPPKYKYHRLAVISITIVFLLWVRSFTATVSFLIVISYYFDLHRIVIGRLNKKSTLHLFLLLSFILLFLAIFALSFDFGFESLHIVFKSVLSQIFMAFGQQNYNEQGGTFFGEFLTRFDKLIFSDLFHNPELFIIGDGFFSSYGHPSGGDFGIIESIYSFGILMSLFVVFSLLYILAPHFHRINRYVHSSDFSLRLLAWSFFVVFYSFLTELHYSIWTSKSVLPLLFVALAFLSNHANSNQKSFTQ